jgi:hypothetical protein
MTPARATTQRIQGTVKGIHVNDRRTILAFEAKGRTKGTSHVKELDWIAAFLCSLGAALLKVLPLGVALGMSACATATTPSTMELLSQAGFRRLPADTPQKVAHLQTLPDQRLVARTYQGKQYYVYSDPKGCNCLYVGNTAQYQTYQTIVRQQQQAGQYRQQEEAAEDDREWELEMIDRGGPRN